MKKKTVFLDRDGTIIVDKVYLNDPNQIEYLPGVFTALSRLRDLGFQFVIVTNQSGVARGLVTLENLHKIHELIANEFAHHDIKFAGFYYAPYSVESKHPMRKPEPGMLLLAGNEHHSDMSQSWMIGDRMSDIEAGRRAGTSTILLAGTESPDGSEFQGPSYIAADISDAVNHIIASL